MTLQHAIIASVLFCAVGCSGPREETTTVPAAGAETADPTAAAESEPPAVEETPPAIEAPTIDEEADEVADDEHEDAEATQPVCSSFYFDMRGMPHIGPREVDQGGIQARANGIIRDVRAAAGEPLVQTFSSGDGSPFTALFTGPRAAARCERARNEVAPPIPEGVTGRRRFGYTRADPCGPCSELVLEAWAGGE